MREIGLCSGAVLESGQTAEHAGHAREDIDTEVWYLVHSLLFATFLFLFYQVRDICRNSMSGWLFVLVRLILIL